MHLTHFRIIAFLLITAILPLAAAESYNAKSIHAAERAGTFDPSEVFFRGDSKGNKVNFKVGEEMNFKFSIFYGKKFKPNKPFKIRWRRFGDDGKAYNRNYQATEITPDKPVIFKTSAHRPGFVTVRAWLLDSDGKEVKIKGRPLMFTGALGAEIEKLKPLPEPKDFDAFWKTKLAELAKVAMKPELTPVPSKDPAVKVWKFSIPCVGDMPSTGYIYMPTGAKAKTLPAIAYFFGYGQPADLKIYYRQGRKNLVLSVSRFGIKQGESEEYYAKERKKIGRYGFLNNEDRETSYFKGMLLRDFRAVEFLKSRPEWNGRDLTITGGSMGGLQSLWVAGLDPAVTKIDIRYPWCCDLGAELDKRPRSDWAPKYTPALAYYDAVNFAKRIPKTAKLKIFTGLGDRVCPVTGVTLAYLVAPCTKAITYKQAATHMKSHAKPQILKMSHKAK